MARTQGAGGEGGAADASFRGAERGKKMSWFPSALFLERQQENEAVGVEKYIICKYERA